MSEFSGAAAVITGGSRGIGAGIAMALANRGAKVTVAGRDQSALTKVVETIRASGGVAEAVEGDLTQEASAALLREEAERNFGPVSLLVMCAGGGQRARPLAEESLDSWKNGLDLNLTSAFLTLKAFLPAMMEAKCGAIVTTSSSAGRQLSGASAPYTAAKSGLQALMRQAAAEAAPSGVRINAIAPSAIVTDKLAAAPEAVRNTLAASFPLRRIGQIEDVVEAALFLLSERSNWITGITLDVAGGRVML
jgi:3-oxoacyl-[acyl-carrier protein] reductase